MNYVLSYVCRHGFILAALNMPTGERWAYATYLLHVLMHEHRILPYVMMYDINCRCVAISGSSSYALAMRQFFQHLVRLAMQNSVVSSFSRHSKFPRIQNFCTFAGSRLTSRAGCNIIVGGRKSCRIGLCSGWPCRCHHSMPTCTWQPARPRTPSAVCQLAALALVSPQSR